LKWDGLNETLTFKSAKTSLNSSGELTITGGKVGN